MAELNVTALHAKLHVFPRNDADPKLTRSRGHMMRSTVQHQPRPKAVGCMLKLADVAQMT